MDYNIETIKLDVTAFVGFQIKKQADVRKLHDILIENDIDVGFNTLRRLYQFLPYSQPRSKTLNSLSRFLGYRNYNQYQNSLFQNNNWSGWLATNRIELTDHLDTNEIEDLLALQSNPNYFQMLFAVIKAFNYRNRIDLLSILFSHESLFKPDDRFNSEGLKIAYFFLNSLHLKSKKEIESYYPLLKKGSVFKTQILDLFIDYRHLTGYYGQLTEERLKTESDPASILFCQLLLNYRLFLNGREDFKKVNFNPPINQLPSVLIGRYISYQIIYLHYKKGESIKRLFEKLLPKIINKDDVFIFIEIIPALLFIKDFEKIDVIINRNYENLFDHSPWNNYVHQCLYLIACSLSDLKKGDLKPAQTTMSIINLEKMEGTAYFEYTALFYHIAQYHIEKSTKNRPHKLNEVKDKYTALRRATGFKRFSTTFLKNY